MDIIKRQRWGAQFARGFAPAPLPAQELWLHHSVTAGGGVAASFETDVRSVQRLEEIGQDRFSGGISYTFAVCESGRVFEGHGVDRRGAHTGGRNSIARAIVLVGNYQAQEPTGPQLAAVAELVALGHVQGWWDRPALDGGHRDAPGASTACPGDRAYRRIADINRVAAGPVAHPFPEQEDDLTPEQDAMLRTVHAELTKRLPNRRGPDGAPLRNQDGSVAGADTVLGYAGNADGFGFRASWEIAGLHETLDRQEAMLAGLAERLESRPASAAPELDYRRLAIAMIDVLGH